MRSRPALSHRGIFGAFVGLCLLAPLLTIGSVGAAPTQEITIGISYDGLELGALDPADDNGLIAAGDEVGVQVDWNSNEEDDVETIVEVIVPEPSSWSATLPSPCLTTGMATPSTIVLDGTNATLVCNLGDQPEGSSGTFLAPMIAGSSPSGTVVPIVATIGPATSNEVQVEIVSDPASYSIGKSIRRSPVPSVGRGAWAPEVPLQSPIVDSGGERGSLVIFPVMIWNTGPLVGAAALDDTVPIVFDDYIGGLGYPNARLATAADMTAGGRAGKEICGPVDVPMPGVPWGAPGIAPTADTTNSATGSGNWSCVWGGTLAGSDGSVGTADDGTGIVNVTITGQNTATASRPTKASDQGNLGSFTGVTPVDRGERIVISGQIAVWIPESDVEARLGTPPQGTIHSWNQVGVWVDDDADGVVDKDNDVADNGADELKAWTHPRPDGSIMTDSSNGGIPANNITNDGASDDFQRLTVNRTEPGSYTFYYTGQYQEVTRSLLPFTHTVYDTRNAGDSGGHFRYPQTQTQGNAGRYAGDGTVLPGEYFTSFQVKSRYTSNVAQNFVMCQMYDTRMITVTDKQPWEVHDTGLNFPETSAITQMPGVAGEVTHILPYSGSQTSGIGNDLALTAGVDYVIEYSSVPPQASEGSSGATPGNTAGAPGSGWNTATSCDDDLDGDGLNDWTSDLSDARFNAVPNTNGFGSEYPDLTRLRIRTLRAQAPTEHFSTYTVLKADPDPGLGALGTLVPTSASFATWGDGDSWTGTAGDGTVSAYAGNVYDAVVHCTNYTSPDCPNDGTNQSNGDLGYGDRIAIGDAYTSVVKAVVGQRTDLRIGDEANWMITAHVVDSSVNGAQNVVVTDTIPAGMSFVSANPAPTSVVGNLITWNIGNVATPYKGLFEVTTLIEDGQPLQNYQNIVRLDADDWEGNAFPQKAANRSVYLGSSYGEFEVDKGSPQSSVEPGSQVVFDLGFRNVGPTSLTDPVLIDVLPWNGDSAVPPTNVAWPFPASSTAPPSGSILSPGDGRLVPSSFGGSLDYVSITGTNSETFEFTMQDPALISPDPDDPSNQPAGATVWCAAFGGAGCPADASEVTAIRVTSTSAMTGGEQRNLTLTLQTVDNSCDDVYTNNFGSRTDSLLLPVRSNDVSVVARWCPEIDLEKATNGVDSDTPTGESIPVGDPVTWTYVVTNTGSTALANATVTDVPAQTIDCGSGTAVIPLLLPGQSATCTATGVASLGQYANSATVSGDPVAPVDVDSDPTIDPDDPATWPTDASSYAAITDPGTGEAADPVTHTDDSHYLGVELSSIAGTVHVDGDGNGAADTGETPIAGVTITLTGTDINGNPITLTTTTDANGDYLFEDLLPGTYTVTQTQPAGYGNGPDAVGSEAGTGADDETSAIVLGAGVDAVDYDFGETLGSISDTVWVDLNNDGVIDGDETLLEGVTVELLDDQGNVIATTTTGADGRYSFDGLLAGDYQVRVVSSSLPAGLEQVFDEDSSLDHLTDVALGAGEAITADVAFGYNEPTPTTTTTTASAPPPAIAFTGREASEPTHFGVAMISAGLFLVAAAGVLRRRED